MASLLGLIQTLAMIFSRAVLNRPLLSSCRRYVTITTLPDPRPRLRNEIKEAMKNRDRDTSTILRSVISEIDSAAKNSKNELTNSDIVGVIRTAVQRRADAAKIFTDAKRDDLAEKELKEAELLSRFVPPLLSVDDIDTHIKDILANSAAVVDPRKALPNVFKEFYSKVDKSMVDRNLVKERAQELLASQNKP